jgi:hypothetical protein
VYYLSAEFLMGRSLLNTIYNLGLGGEYGKALTQMGYKMEEVADQEHNAGTGGVTMRGETAILVIICCAQPNLVQQVYSKLRPTELG